MTTAGAPNPKSRRRRRLTPHLRVVLTRWVVVLAIAYAILFRGDTVAPLFPNQIFAAALFIYNGVVTWLMGEGLAKDKLRMFVTMADIGAVSAAIAISGNASTDFFLIYFAVIMLAAISHRLSVVATMAAVVCVAYTVLLYMEVGPALWRSSSLLIRVPFIFGVAIFFGTVAQEWTKETSRAEKLEDETERLSVEREQLASELGFLRALSDIGKQALTGTYPGPVLFEICRSIQDAVHVGRCSLVIFERDGSVGYLAASGDDPDIEVLVMPLDAYPELNASYVGRTVIELRPGHPKDLWDQVSELMPEDSPFQSSLIAPIQWGDSILGVLFLRDSDADRVYDEKYHDFCSTASVMLAGFIRSQDLLEKLRRRSREDSLTGLLNFHTFRDDAAKALEAGKGEEVGPFTMVVADIDNLRDINDAAGQAVGNRVITGVGGLLAGVLPRGSLVARYGGDEFVALSGSDQSSTIETMNDLLEAIERELHSLPQTIRLSVGLASYPVDGKNVTELVEAANQAMFGAKSAGGHQVCTCEVGAGAAAAAAAQDAAEAASEAPAQPAVQLPAKLAGLESATLESPELRQALVQWADELEASNPYTQDHSRKVGDLAGKTARAMGLSEQEAVAIELAGLAHDLGRSAIREEVLVRDGKLTDEEKRELERVPEKGAEMISAHPALQPVVPLVKSHQERWNGSGYPQGLEGDQIPLGAQIVGICDVYQVLLTPRAYRPGFDEAQARDIIMQGSDKVWNPEVVKAFLAHVVEQKSMASLTGESSPGATGDSSGPQSTAEVR